MRSNWLRATQTKRGNMDRILFAAVLLLAILRHTYSPSETTSELQLNANSRKDLPILIKPKSLLQNSNKSNIARLRRRRSPIPAQGYCNPGIEAISRTLTLKALANGTLANSFRVSPIVLNTAEVPGLLQPWAVISERLRRKTTAT